MSLYKNKYRVESTRLKGWDYSRPGFYFITICVKNKKCIFGRIKNGEMVLSEAGKISSKYWSTIPEHFPFVRLDQYIIMPNHIHGIIEIQSAPVNNNSIPVETPNLGVSKSNKADVETPNLGVSTANKIDGRMIVQWKPKSIGVIINQYKRICTIEIRKQMPSFCWQSRYYDHIIRTEEELNRIREYIMHNPMKWSDDEYFIL